MHFMISNALVLLGRVLQIIRRRRHPAMLFHGLCPECLNLASGISRDRADWPEGGGRATGPARARVSPGRRPVRIERS